VQSARSTRTTLWVIFVLIPVALVVLWLIIASASRSGF
jgi:hypothetical protein